jgi:hypothetical protein
MRKRTSRGRVALAVLAAVLAVGALSPAAATASSDPVELTFSKVFVGGGMWQGSVSGDISGGLTSQITELTVEGSTWQVEFDWIVSAGDQSFTAHLAGLVNTQTGRVVMNGTVVQGYLLGAQVHEEGQIINANGDAVGSIQIMPASAG